MKAIGQMNIQRVVAVDMDAQTPAEKFVGNDFVDEAGFFIRAGGAGNIQYCPVGNNDLEAITKPFAVSDIFVDPEECRKIFGQSTTATLIYVGYGV